MTALILRGDARALPLPDASVDLIVTSPPYFALRSYTDGGESYPGQIGAESTPREYITALLDCTREWVRVLKPSGSLFVNLGDKYATDGRGPDGSSSGLTNGAQQRPRISRAADAGVPRKSLIGLPWRYALRCLDDLGLTLRAEIIWSKTNGMPESAGDRVHRTHETWFHFVTERTYFADIDEIRLPLAYDTLRHSKHGGRDQPFKARNANHARMSRVGYAGPNLLGAVPGSVWEVATEPLNIPDYLGEDHYAAFPMTWPREFTRAWSPCGGVVLDPFGGTGTTAAAAAALGRTGISVDRSASYCRIAGWRTTDPAQRAKAMGVPKPPAQLSGQVALFDDDLTEEGTAA